MGRGAGSGQQRTAVREQRGQRELILAALRRLDLDAWEVGGCVRDDLLGREATDIDIAVSGISLDDLDERLAGEGRVMDLRIVTDYDEQVIGKRITASWTPPDGIEIALAREEVSTGPRHQDFAITPIAAAAVDEYQAQGLDRQQAHTEVMRRDAARRDWTVNAIMRSVRTGEIFDPFDGVADLRARRLHPVSPDTCRDDPLRVLRGLARISQDQLVASPEASAQMREHAPRLDHLTPDKIGKQMDKIIGGPDAARALREARDLGVLAHALPEFAPSIGYDQDSSYHELDADEHSLLALQRAVELDAPTPVRWAMLLHDTGKAMMGWRTPAQPRLGKPATQQRFYVNPDAGPGDPANFPHEEWSAALAHQALLRYELKNRGQIVTLVREHMFDDDTDFAKLSSYRRKIKARRFIARVGRDNAEAVLLVRRCDRSAKHPNQAVDAAETLFENVVRAEMDCPIRPKDLALGGRELISLGLEPSPRTGAILAELVQRVMDQEDPGHANRRSGLEPQEWLARIGNKDSFRELPLLERWAATAVAAALAETNDG
jgi:tRNA nucleotidyltransferase/poly(A) polymerase